MPADSAPGGVLEHNLDVGIAAGHGDPIIVCAMPGTGPNAATFGGLVLAGHTSEGRLHCIGGVGTGFSPSPGARSVLRSKRSAATPAAWSVEPIFVADIEYRELSGDGLLRHPSFRGLRSDKTPDQVGLPY
ncbi:hypothetical protein ACIGO9_31635 [Nocardia asteroides]|uniref:ATP dependent DNA ligase n=1 Tax=Nocardia asteroides TaxID=1824 RepID=UPI0037CA3121